MSLSSLPDELILQCFARLPNKSRYTASFVCSKWLELLESREFYLLRKQLGHINRLGCFVKPHPPPPPTCSSNPPPTPTSHVISVLGIGSGLCKTLPPLPNPSIQIDDDCKIVSSEEKLILMKNSDPLNLHLGNPIFVFDFATGRWHQGKSLPARKSAFAMDATVDDCRVFVAGGYHPEEEGGDFDSSWMYDVRKDEWSELPPFQHVNGISTGKIIGDNFIVMTLCRIRTCLKTHIEVYNFELREWKKDPKKVFRLSWRLCEYCFIPKNSKEIHFGDKIMVLSQ